VGLWIAWKGLSATLVCWDATTWSRQVLDLAEPRDKPLCLSVLISLWLLCFARTHLQPLGIIVLTLNQVCGFEFKFFTGSPIHPPPSRYSQKEKSENTNTHVRKRGRRRRRHTRSMVSAVAVREWWERRPLDLGRDESRDLFLFFLTATWWMCKDLEVSSWISFYGKVPVAAAGHVMLS
jgi:hypothetical protein